MSARIVQITAGQKTSVVLRIIESRTAKTVQNNLDLGLGARFADVDLRIEWVAAKAVGRPAKFHVDKLVELLPADGATWTAWQLSAKTAGCPRSSFRRLVHKAVAGGLVSRRSEIYFQVRN